MPNTASPDTDSSKTNAAGVRSERSVIGTPQVILVIMGVYAAYHHPIIERLRKRVAPSGFGVLCVTGQEITSESSNSDIPSIYRIAAQLNVAGTIILAGSLGHSSDSSRLTHFVNHFKHHRLVTTDLKGTHWSSVVYENEPAMRGLVAHMLDNTSDNNIAFLSGFTSSTNSIERERAFRSVMSERGRQVDESLMLCADYSAAKSFLVIDKLLSSGRCPSAIIAANDAMALGAIDALMHHGKMVPHDVLVSGFDDAEYAQNSSIPITTVRASAERQIDKAGEELLRLIVSGDTPTLKKISLPLEMILRESSSVPAIDVVLSENPKFNEPHKLVAKTDTLMRRLVNRNRTDSLTSHEISERFEIHERFHVRIARCTDRNSVYEVFDEGMQALFIQRAFLVGFESNSDSEIQAAKLLHAWPGHDVYSANQSYSPGQLLPSELAHELSQGTLVLCGVEIDGCSVGALLFDPFGPEKTSMDGLAQTTFGALRHFEQCENLEQQSYELATANEELVRLANLDPLTGLANRSRLLAELKYSLDQNSEGVVVVFFDLDGFKPVNDTLGHAAGDRVLKIMARRLRACLREYDVVARFGGDEFVVLLRNMYSSDDIKDVTQQLLSEVSRPMRLSRDHPISLTASVGVACTTERLKSANELMQHADTAMYRAKRMGGNRVVSFTDELEQEVGEQLRVEKAIQEGLSLGQFRIVFQPRVDLTTGRIVTVEALLRWRKSDGTEVSPDLFIKTAEQSGVIARLDAFAFRKACDVAADWYRRGINCCMSVNLSVARLQQFGLASEIKSILARYDLPPERLELEVTETAAMTDVDANIDTLESLRSMGLRLSIDDFGTAYSSLGYLRNLPIDCVKIDRLFLSTIVSGEARKNPDAQIMRAMVALGNGLGLRVVAEGVENEDQLNFLVNVGCDEAQGYLFSPPLELAAVEAMLLENFEELSDEHALASPKKPLDEEAKLFVSLHKDDDSVIV